MGSNTIRVEKRGAVAKVFLPDGSQLLGVRSVEVGGLGAQEFGQLTLVITDFIVKSEVISSGTPEKDGP